MAKLKLNPEPTFKAKVKIPVPGGAPVPVEFTFKHKGRAELKEWLTVPQDGPQESESFYVRQFVAGWELDDEFSDDNIERLCDSYPGAASAILDAYIDEMRGARAKN